MNEHNINITYYKLIGRINQLENENRILEIKNEHLAKENAELRRELQKPERMTAAEQMAYWGMFS